MKIIPLIRNKYIVSLTAFIVFVLFIDHNDIFIQLDRQRQLKSLLTSKAWYQQQIELTQKNLDALQNSPSALEKYAREKFYLKRDNEDLFVVPVQNIQKNIPGKQ
jgi:cell division protein DivIC